MIVQETFMKLQEVVYGGRYTNQWEGNLRHSFHDCCRNMVYLGKKLAQVCNLIG